MNASVPSANISLYIAERSGFVAMVFATFWVRWQGSAWPSASDRGGRIERFALQLSEHEVGEVAWPFSLAWASGESALN